MSMEKLINQVADLSLAETIVAYGTKMDAHTGGVRDTDLCLVVETADKSALEHRLYISVESDISFDLIIYTPEEWDTLTADPQSFAHRIREKGKVVYERQKD